MLKHIRKPSLGDKIYAKYKKEIDEAAKKVEKKVVEVVPKLKTKKTK